VSALTGARSDLVIPSQDGLFTSGTLGRYSNYLREIHEHQSQQLAEAAAD